MFATRGSPSELAVDLVEVRVMQERAEVADRAPCTGRSRRPHRPALANRSCITFTEVTRGRSLSEPTPYTQTVVPRRAGRRGAVPRHGIMETPDQPPETE